MNLIRRILTCIFAMIAVTVSVLQPSSAVFAGDDRIVVVLDPGHGGKDPGAAGIRDEAYYNLQVALAAKAKLEANGNFVVHMTRSTPDKYLTLAERLYYADTVNADVVISIHFNSGTNPSTNGVEVYGSVLDRFYLGVLGQKIATGVSSAAGIGNRGVFRKYDYGSTLYYWSEEYQWDIPDDKSVGGLSDYYGIITWGAKFGIPSLIVEHAYLSNPSDRTIIEDPAVLKAMGEADADALISYYTNHDHVYGKEVVDAPVTCFSAGKKSLHCTVCDHRKNITSVAATPDNTKHIWIAEEDATTPTCETDGYAKYYCRYTHNLNDKGCTQFAVHRTEAVTPAYGHDYQVTFHREVTHTVDGITTYTCTRCSGSYSETIPAEGHSYALTSHTDPDCVNAGSDVYACPECGESYSNPIPALGHDFKIVERTDPTCETEGSEHRICNTCNFEETIQLPAPGHDFVIHSDVMSNCTEEGLRITKCTVCEKMEQEVTPKSGHSFAIIAETKPTCTESGESKQQCIVCFLEETVVTDPLGHTPESEEKIDASCTDTVYRDAVCSVCKESYKITVPPKGHLFDEGTPISSPGLFFDGKVEYVCEYDPGHKEIRYVRDLTLWEFVDAHPAQFSVMCGAAVIIIGGAAVLAVITRKKAKSKASAKLTDAEEKTPEAVE